MLQILGRGQRWSRGHKGRGQEHTQKKSQAKAEDSPTEDRPSRDQDQECSTPRPRTKDSSAIVLKKKKKRSSKKFSDVLQQKTSPKIFFQAIYKISTIQKKYCPRAEDRAIFEDLRPRGQGQRFDLRGQGQGLQNVSSRTPPLVELSKPRLEVRYGTFKIWT